MKETFEFMMLRRGAAGDLPGKSLPGSNHEPHGLTNPVAEEVRSQAMGHVNGSIYEKSYRNQIIDADIVSAFLEAPSDEAIMKLMGHISLTQDPNAPAEPTSAQRRQVQADVEVIAAKNQANASTKTIRDRYGSLAAAKRKAQEDPTVQIEFDENTRLRKDHDSLFKRKLTSLFEISREEYFSTLGAACLENQHTGQEEPAGPSIPAFLFSEREALRSCYSLHQRPSLNLIKSRLKTAVKLSDSMPLCVAAVSIHGRDAGHKMTVKTSPRNRKRSQKSSPASSIPSPISIPCSVLEPNVCSA